MLYREIIAVCSQIHTKHIYTLCGQNVELLTVKLTVRKVTTALWRIKSVCALWTVRHVNMPRASRWRQLSTAPTSQHSHVLLYLWSAQYRAALMVSSGIWCHEGVRWNAFKQCILYPTRQCRSVSPTLGQQPPPVCSLISRHWRPYFLSLLDQKIERLQVYLPYVRLSAG